MTQRYGINRQTDNAVTSSRHINNQSAATAAKSADVENFNAAMRARENINEDSKETKGQSETPKHCELSTTGAQVTAAVPVTHYPESAFTATNNRTTVTPAFGTSQSGMSSTGGSITLALTLPSGTTPAVQQATTIIHRIIQTNAGAKDSRTWNLQLSIDGTQHFTICVEYHGKTDWAIGLLDERNSSGQPVEEYGKEQLEFTQELRKQLQNRNPTLHISSLRAGRYS